MSKNRKIVHVLIGESSISESIIKNTVQRSTFAASFIITRGADVITYRRLFDGLGVRDYVFCDELKPSRVGGWVERVSRRCGGRLSSLLTWLPVPELSAMWKARCEPVLLHGISFSLLAHILVLCRFRSLSYVCWGYVPKPANRFLQARFLFAIHRIMYSRFKHVVCLMNEDRDDFAKLFGLKALSTIAYGGEILEYDAPLIALQKHGGALPAVLLGNSACYTDSYLRLLPLLQERGGGFTVSCMLSYPRVDAGKKDEVLARFAATFGPRFQPWVQQLSMTQYMEKLKTFDIYVCGVERQTGLGAIYAMLLFGKKLYLTGKNLSWIRENRFIVYDVMEIGTQTESDFLAPLKLEVREHNRTCLRELLSSNALALRWDALYAQL